MATILKRSLIALALYAAVAAAQAAPWTYRGTLEDGGRPANGRYDIRLSLLDSNAAKSIGGAITFPDVLVGNGSFSIDVDFGFDLTKFSALNLKTEVQQGGSGFVSIGEPSHFDAKAVLAGVCWDTTGNVVAAGEFLGASNDVGVEIKANNLRAARFKAAGTAASFGDAPQVVLGSAANSATGIGATVGGGGATKDVAGTDCPTCGNAAVGAFATVSGGQKNATTGNYATIGGGMRNTASGPTSTASGGQLNVASGDYATIGGGNENTASNYYSTIGGGDANSAEGDFSSVSGGQFNCAGGDYSWAGGRNAQVRRGNGVADGICSPSSGDSDGDEGTFVWSGNAGTTFTSTGPNQFLIRAQGGVAINTNAPTANAALTVNGNVSIPNPGNVAFGATTRQMLNLFNADYGIGIQAARMYFRVADTGGFNWFEGGVHSDAVDNAGGGTRHMNLSTNGQLTTTTGTISTISDVRLKKDVRDYDGALDQISLLRPVHYRYINAGKADFQPEGEHLGFIAQEVQTVFPQWVNTDESGYLSLSMRGFEAVAVKAIQELNSKLESDNAELRARLDAAQARLGRLEAALDNRRP